MAFGKQNTTFTNLALVGIIGYLGWKAYQANEFGLADMVDPYIGGISDGDIDDVNDAAPSTEVIAEMPTTQVPGVTILPGIDDMFQLPTPEYTTQPIGVDELRRLGYNV